MHAYIHRVCGCIYTPCLCAVCTVCTCIHTYVRTCMHTMNTQHRDSCIPMHAAPCRWACRRAMPRCAPPVWFLTAARIMSPVDRWQTPCSLTMMSDCVPFPVNEHVCGHVYGHAHGHVCGHVHGHVCGHVHGHVYGHVYRHVCRHVYRDVYRHVYTSRYRR